MANARQEHRTGAMGEPNEEKHVGRQVIEDKLLTALEDEGTVAILASQDDLDLLIRACDGACASVDEYVARRDMAASLRQLKRAAFE